MPAVLVDTNLLLYLYDPNSPAKQQRARLVLDQLFQLRAGRLSVQNLAEFISATIRKLDPPLTAAQAYEQAAMLAASWPIFDLTSQIVLEAGRGVRDYGLSYYDAQVWASARLNQVQVIFSEDFQDGQILEGVRFVNPFSAQFNLVDWVYN